MAKIVYSVVNSSPEIQELLDKKIVTGVEIPVEIRIDSLIIARYGTNKKALRTIAKSLTGLYGNAQ